MRTAKEIESDYDDTITNAYETLTRLKAAEKSYLERQDHLTKLEDQRAGASLPPREFVDLYVRARRRHLDADRELRELGRKFEQLVLAAANLLNEADRVGAPRPAREP